jgi:transposase InsO family protein
MESPNRCYEDPHKIDHGSVFVSDNFRAWCRHLAISIQPAHLATGSDNAICERMIGALRREIFDRLLIVNEHHLREVLTEYLQHYNTPGRTVPSDSSP